MSEILQKKKTNFGVKWFIKLLVLVVLLCLLLYFVEWVEVWAYFLAMDYRFVFMYFITYLFALVLSAWKWRAIGKVFGFDGTLHFYISTYVSATFINNFLPSFIGGDAYRALSLAKLHDADHPPRGRALQTVILDRFSGLLAVLSLATVFGTFFVLFFEHHSEIARRIVTLNWIVMVGVALFFFCYFRGYFAFLKITLPSKFLQYSDMLFRTLSIKQWVYIYGLSALFAFVGVALLNYFLFIAIGEYVPLLSYLSVVFVIAIVGSVPISIGNIGIKEWAYVLFFGFVGVPASACVTVVIVSRVIQMLISLVAVPLYLQEQKNLRD